MGERLALWFLEDKGLKLVDSNRRVPGGEIDLLMRDGHLTVAVEVRTRVGGSDPADAADQRKRVHAASIARRTGASRFDVVGVRVDRYGFDVHWVPEAA